MQLCVNLILSDIQSHHILSTDIDIHYVERCFLEKSSRKPIWLKYSKLVFKKTILSNKLIDILLKSNNKSHKEV